MHDLDNKKGVCLGAVDDKEEFTACKINKDDDCGKIFQEFGKVLGDKTCQKTMENLKTMKNVSSSLDCLLKFVAEAIGEQTDETNAGKISALSSVAMLLSVLMLLHS